MKIRKPIDDRFAATRRPRCARSRDSAISRRPSSITSGPKGPSDVKAVYRAVGPPRGITLNTVQSAMAREKVSHAYVYSPRHSREELGARVVQDVVARLLEGEATPVLEALVDLAVRTDEATLDRLGQLIALHAVRLATGPPRAGKDGRNDFAAPDGIALSQDDREIASTSCPKLSSSGASDEPPSAWPAWTARASKRQHDPLA